MTAEEKGFVAALKKNSEDATARGAYADWLDEHGRTYEALIQRDKAGIAEAWFKLRCKTTGLFSEGLASGRHKIAWSAKGRMWRTLGSLRSHLTGLSYEQRYGGQSWSELEVIVIELRPAVTATLPVTVTKKITGFHRGRSIKVVEPHGESGDEK
jgi:uncharacterized protein (TIGR02996 family)